MKEASVHQAVQQTPIISKRGQGACAALFAVACSLLTLWLTASAGSDYIGTYGASCGTGRLATLSTLCFAPFPLSIGFSGWLAAKSANFGSLVARCALTSAGIGWFSAFVFTQTFHHFIK